MAKDSERDPQNDPGDMKENALERVEAHEAVLVIGIEDQKDDSGDDGYVGQGASNVFRESTYLGLRTCGRCGCGRTSARACTCGAGGCSGWNLVTTIRTESHEVLQDGCVPRVAGSDSCRQLSAIGPERYQIRQLQAMKIPPAGKAGPEAMPAAGMALWQRHPGLPP